MFMKGKLGILMVIAALYPLGISAQGIYAVIEKLEDIGDFQADVNYCVSLPSVTDDVVYEVELVARPASPADSLAESDYLIEWKLPVEEGFSEGFLAYFDGHHYRYRDHRLQEYHFEWDSIPFLTGRGGVQRNGQFVDLLPRSIARELKAMAADSSFTVACSLDTMVAGVKSDVVKATQSIKGYDGRYFTLVVDSKSGRPLRIENEYNPMQISEQLVTVRYDYGAPSAELADVYSETKLMEMYPEVFEKYRENNYRIENLKGLPLPGFSLPTTTGERYTRHRGDSFAAVTVLVLIDPSVATASETISALRKAQLSAPRQTDLVFAFTSNNVDTIEPLIGEARVGEFYLMSSRSLARDCGTNLYPTVIVADTKGNVADVMLGFNNNLGSDVIQSVALVK